MFCAVEKLSITAWNRLAAAQQQLRCRPRHTLRSTGSGSERATLTVYRLYSCMLLLPSTVCLAAAAVAVVAALTSWHCSFHSWNLRVMSSKSK